MLCYVYHVWLPEWRKFEQINKSVHSTFHRNGSKKSSPTHLCIQCTQLICVVGRSRTVPRNGLELLRRAFSQCHGFCLFSLFRVYQDQLWTTTWGRKFSVKLLINIEKVHPSCEVLKAGGDCQNEYLMQHRNGEISHIRLSIPLLFAGIVDFFQSSAE